MNVSELTRTERIHRQNIRNAFLTATIAEMEAGKERQTPHGVRCLQEMIDECVKHGVDNFGETPL